jgi:hypothetical protein
MKKICTVILFFAALVGCGGSAAPTFDGVWNGSFTSLQNDCPFSVAEDVNPLFPMTVSVDENDVFTVVAVDGSTATGGQGPGETISFLAQAPKFGSYGSIAPYTCSSIQSGVGYLTQGDNQAKVTLTITFTDCNTPGSTSSAVTCGAIYYGDATRS